MQKKSEKLALIFSPPSGPKGGEKNQSEIYTLGVYADFDTTGVVYMPGHVHMNHIYQYLSNTQEMRVLPKK